MDLVFKGPKFTWCNGRFEGNFVYARLDRGLHNQEWLQFFPQSSLSHIPFGFSDHMALMVKVQVTPEIKPAKKYRFFCFEAFWMRGPNCEDIIRSSWDLFFWGTPMFKLTQKIKAVKMALLQWGGGNARSFIKSEKILIGQS